MPCLRRTENVMNGLRNRPMNEGGDMTEQMNRGDILDAAKQCVCRDRQDQYGAPENSFAVIALLWREYLAPKNMSVQLDAHDAAMMLALLKVARIMVGQPKADNYIDAAGYLALAGELSKAES